MRFATHVDAATVNRIACRLSCSLATYASSAASRCVANVVVATSSTSDASMHATTIAMIEVVASIYVDALNCFLTRCLASRSPYPLFAVPVSLRSRFFFWSIHYR